jgi:YidC/Oxa1 family membrane protein insertase
MYDRKIYLYFALAIIGFFLWNAWEKDYAAKPTPITAAAAPASFDSVLPAQQSTPGSATVSQERMVTVKTDILDVKIDKLGGNIVSLKLLKYPTSYETPNDPQSLITPDLTKFYAVQSGIVGKGNVDTSKVVFNTTADSYQMDPNNNNLSVTLKGKADGVDVQKTYTFKKGKYDIGLSYQITNTGNQPWSGSSFNQIKRRGLTADTGTFGLHTYTGAAVSSAEKPYEKISYKDMDKGNLDRNIKGGWLAMQERYFVSALIPNQQENLRYYSSVQPLSSSNKPADHIYTIGFQTPTVNLAPSQTQTINSILYSGPEITANLKQVAPHLDLVIDYGWLSIFSVPIFKVMQWIYQFVGNWGVAIILVTLLIKLLFYKLSESSYRSMARMKSLQPKLLALKDRYGDDRQKLSQATMELYRKEKVNPLGGCLPMLVQIPVFIALYYVLIESVELRQAPFIFWIHDLSVKDPYYILPILMGLSWMLQQRLNPPPPDPVQAKMMMLFPVIFTLLFATFPSGLVLYWLVNNCLSILQQWYIMKKVENTQAKKKKAVTKKGRVSSP